MQENQSITQNPFFYTVLAFSLFISTRQFYRKYKDSFFHTSSFYDSYNNFFTKINKTLYFGLYDDKDNKDNKISNSATNNQIEVNIQKKKEIKYEDKYLEQFRAKNKEYEFTEKETKRMEEITENEYKTTKNNYEKRYTEINTKIQKIKNEIPLLEKMLPNEFYGTYFDNDSDDEYNYVNEHSLKGEFINNKHELWKQYEEELALLEKHINDDVTIRTDSANYAKNSIIETRINNLKGCFVMEYTPLGNVLMLYNKERTTFSYYSDSTIPYRFLEVVSRKFVNMFDCRPIFVDMEEEIKKYGIKMEEEKKKKEELLINELGKNNDSNKSTKNVFAKMKNYNKPNGKVNNAPPPKSSIPNTNLKNETNQVSLKEEANRYTYEGKISTFNILKKVERKVVDKKYNISFSDFKKLNMDKIKL